MTVGEFAENVKALVEPHGGSVTSWGRSDAHAKKVGGFAGDPHTWWLGCDVVYDDVVPSIQRITQEAERLGLKLLREPTHDHIQPRNFPAGPVTSYEWRTRQ